MARAAVSEPLPAAHPLADAGGMRRAVRLDMRSLAAHQLALAQKVGTSGKPQLGSAITRLRQACLRLWSWSVSDEPDLAELGQRYLLEEVDRILWLAQELAFEEDHPLAALRRVRRLSQELVSKGLRALFLERNHAGFFPCFQGLFVAEGLPLLTTFDGPRAPPPELSLRAGVDKRPPELRRVPIKATSVHEEAALPGEQTLEDGGEGPG